MNSLESVLKEVWPLVRERHLFPQLPPPRFCTALTNVALDIKAKEISISAPFVQSMTPKLAPHRILEGLLDHAVSHYLYCPWDVATHLKLYHEARCVLPNADMARKAADIFMDVVADTFCVSRHASALTDIYRHMPRSPLEQVIHALYQRMWGIDLGAPAGSEIIRKLSYLPYLERSQWPESMRQFARLLYPLLESEAASEPSAKPPPMGSHDLNQYKPPEIEQGLRQLASEINSPIAFNDFLDEFGQALGQYLPRQASQMGVGKGQPDRADVLFYLKLAENHILPIRKRPLHSDGTLYPHTHRPWEIGHPLQEIDPWTSFGRILPGITQSWKRRENKSFGHFEGVPDCMVLIDSSASMINPTQQLSHAVLGAACACDAYLRKGSRVAVCNFSDTTAGDVLTLPYTRHRQQVFNVLCHHFGGGTQLNVDHIHSLQTSDHPDIFLITDMQITNLERLIRYFRQCPNRITAVHIGQSRHTSAFRQAMVQYAHISIQAVEEAGDIPRIVLGQVRSYLYRE